jgi:undecaprenyl diphosphate synthase
MGVFESAKKGAVPEHLAITLFEAPFSGEAYAKRSEIAEMLLSSQVELGIKIMTVFLLDTESRSEEFSLSASSISSIIEKIRPIANSNSVRVSVFGKWYDLPGALVESIKEIISETAENSAFFLNLCINYDGREEISDACRIIALKASSGKLEPSSISKDTIKENISSSYFASPSLVIKNNPPEISSMLLWDSPGAKTIFTGKPWEKFEKKDLLSALSFYSKLID